MNGWKHVGVVVEMKKENKIYQGVSVEPNTIRFGVKPMET